MKPYFLFLFLIFSYASCTKTTTTFKDADFGGFRKDVGDDASTTTIGADDVGVNDSSGFSDFDNKAGDTEVWVPEKGDFVFKDNETGSLWNVRGEAFSGPLKGQKLKQIPAFNAFWFAWSVFYDGSEVWKKGVNSPGKLKEDGECAVPCKEISPACGGGLDCIPALDYDGVDGRPAAELVETDDKGAEYLNENDFVLGIVINGEARAYPHNILWWHEIYNDKIGDTEFSVSFCPLTGSGMAFAGIVEGKPADFGVSGNLYNSNLVMFDRQSKTFWSQMIFTGVKGKHRDLQLSLLPIVETTWKRWKEMYPNTKVVSDSQGYSRRYDSYPYGDYRENHSNTFKATNPKMKDFYKAKNRILGIPTAKTDRAYALLEMEEQGERVVINDTLNGNPIVIIYEAEYRLALPFFSKIEGRKLSFKGTRAP